MSGATRRQPDGRTWRATLVALVALVFVLVGPSGRLAGGLAQALVPAAVEAPAEAVGEPPHVRNAGDVRFLPGQLRARHLAPRRANATRKLAAPSPGPGHLAALGGVAAAVRAAALARERPAPTTSPSSPSPRRLAARGPPPRG